MMVYQLKDDTECIDSKDGNTIKIWSHSGDALHSPSLVKSRDWKEINTVDPGQNDKLEVFGTTIEGQLLRDLATMLKKYLITTNREGYVYAYLRSGSNYVQRFNDMFCWSLFGVKPTVTTIWNRCDWENCHPIVHLQDRDKLLKDFTLKLERVEKALDLCKRFGQCEMALEEKERERGVLEKRLHEKRNQCLQLRKLLQEKEKECADHEKRLQEKREY